MEQKCKGDHGQHDVMMESGPRAPLEVVKAELLLGLLVNVLGSDPDERRRFDLAFFGQIANGSMNSKSKWAGIEPLLIRPIASSGTS